MLPLKLPLTLLVPTREILILHGSLPHNLIPDPRCKPLFPYVLGPDAWLQLSEAK